MVLQPGSGRVGPSNVNRSRAQVVADHLQALIRQQGLEAGDNLGTRAQVREALSEIGATGAAVDGAIRILADRGIVRVKSGIGGGIFIDEPNAGAVILGGGRWQIRPGDGVSRRRIGELLSVIHGLYPLVMAEAALRRNDSDLGLMRDALEAAAKSEGDLMAYELAHHDLHAKMLDATHNDVLIETLQPLLVIHHQKMEPPTPPAHEDPATWLLGRVEVHRAILDAIEVSDCEQVWHALLRHGVTGRDLPSDYDMLPGGFVATQERWRRALEEH